MSGIKDQEEALLLQCGREVEEAAQAFLATAPLDTIEMFAHIYARLPADLLAQKDILLAQPGGAA